MKKKWRNKRVRRHESYRDGEAQLLEYFVSDQRILRGNDETKISLIEWRSNGLDTSIKKGKKVIIVDLQYFPDKYSNELL